VTDVRFAQDEPANQGAWWYMERNLPAAVKTILPDYDLVMQGFTRDESSAPSVGSHHLHDEQESALVKAALGGES
jgi:2-oxoglutarate dehydrogenase E1 component